MIKENMKIHVYKTWRVIAWIVFMGVILPGIVVIPILYFTTDNFQFLYEVNAVSFILLLFSVCIFLMAVLVTLFEKHPSVLVSVCCLYMAPLFLLAHSALSDDISKSAKSGSFVNLLAEMEYQALLEEKELGLTKENLSYVYAYADAEGFKGLLIEDDRYEKMSEKNEKIRKSCNEKALHCYVQDKKTQNIYKLNSSKDYDEYEKISNRFTFNIFK